MIFFRVQSMISLNHNQFYGYLVVISYKYSIKIILENNNINNYLVFIINITIDQSVIIKHLMLKKHLKNLIGNFYR